MQSMKGYVTSGIMAVCGILLSQRSVAQSPAKKNLLFIITDQQRYDALGYAGNPVIQTPNLDSLARRGAYFRNAYTQCAVC